MMMKKLCNCSWGNYFYTTPFLGEKHPFFKGEHSIYTGKHSFHKKDTIFDSSADFFLGRGLWREASPPKSRIPEVDRALDFPVVGFEPVWKKILTSSHYVYNLSPLSKCFTFEFILGSASRNSSNIRFAHIWPQIRSRQNPTDYSVTYKLRWRISRFCLHSCELFLVKVKLPATTIHLGKVIYFWLCFASTETLLRR